MNGRILLIALSALCGGLSLTGCSNGQPRFKGLDSYANATTPNTYEKLPGIDPYSYGGTAYATGGTQPAASYGTGADGQFDGDPAHYAAIEAFNGSSSPPIDWAGGAGDGKAVDTSGIVVPQPPKPIGD